MSDSIRVLLAADCSFADSISDSLKDFKEIDTVEVVECFDNLLEKSLNFDPDVFLLDLDVLQVEGFKVFKNFIEEIPIPTILLVEENVTNANLTVKSFRHGAVDFQTKPLKIPPSDEFTHELLKKIRNARNVTQDQLILTKKEKSTTVEEKETKFSGEIVVIGGSSGSPRQITQILTDLPEDFNTPVLVVLHMPEGMVESYAKRLDSELSFDFRVANDGDKVSKGLGLIAPADRHMVLTEEDSEKIVRLERGDYVNFVRPSADVLMKSVAKTYGEKTIGIVLSGMGKDGAEGMKKIKEYGGRTIVQDEETSQVFGMPKAVIEGEAADIVSPLNKISSKVVEWT